MSSKHGNEKWRALRDDVTADGRPVETTDPLDVWHLLTPEQQQHIARGDFTLDDLLERIVGAQGAETCPRCCERPITVLQTGLCKPCHRAAMTEAQRLVMAELIRQKDSVMVKKQVQRLRDEIDPDRPRRQVRRPFGEYNQFVHSTNAPLMVACTTCEQPFVPRDSTLR